MTELLKFRHHADGYKSKANLNLYSAVFPTLFIRISPVLAHHKPSSARTSKEAFKVYLNYVIGNATLLLNELKDTTIAPALQIQKQEPEEIAKRLLSAQHTITAQEHNQIVQNVITSTAVAT